MIIECRVSFNIPIKFSLSFCNEVFFDQVILFMSWVLEERLKIAKNILERV
jgi:hypothetical protein